jgi:hypothetical protein
MWTKFGQFQEYHAPLEPYTIDDLRTVLGEVTGDPTFAADFFARYIDGREVPDFETLLAAAGLVLQPAAPDVASLGTLPLQVRDDRVVVTGSTAVGSPAYEAGLDRGDVLVSFDGQPVRSPVQLGQLVGSKKPGSSTAACRARPASSCAPTPACRSCRSSRRAGRSPTACARSATTGWARRPAHGELRGTPAAGRARAVDRMRVDAARQRRRSRSGAA